MDMSFAKLKSAPAYEALLGYSDFSPFSRHIKMIIRIKAIRARNGMVIKPNQLIYWPEHGTPLTHGLMPLKPGTFCSK